LSQLSGENYDVESYLWFVAPEHQGDGVGTRLRLEMMKGLRARGVKIVLGITTEHRPIQKFYEATGGKIVTDRNGRVIFLERGEGGEGIFRVGNESNPNKVRWVFYSYDIAEHIRLLEEHLNKKR